MPGKWDVVYSKAVNICKKRNADVGLIRDEESYNAIVNHLRRTMRRDWAWVGIWIRIHIDSRTGDVIPANSFTKWYSDGFPVRDKDRTNIYTVVNKKPNERYQGMVNAPPTWERDGVLCEILI
ncbi:uncharacterized protein LOC144425636 [Styela clava]